MVLTVETKKFLLVVDWCVVGRTRRGSTVLVGFRRQNSILLYEPSIDGYLPVLGRKEKE